MVQGLFYMRITVIQTVYVRNLFAIGSVLIWCILNAAIWKRNGMFLWWSLAKTGGNLLTRK